MEILIATNNSHKVIECARILKGYRIQSPADAGLTFEYEEKGSSFLENAFGKAMALFKQTGKPVIADDSGLCVPALNNAPGVYSARYGAAADGAILTAAAKNEILLQELQACTDRRAFFVCCMVLVVAEHRFFIAQETLQGQIAQAPQGDNGFGYDPVFYVPEAGKSVAQLDDRHKDRISHRGRALRVIKRMLKTAAHLR